jgi:hypothetical protein
MSRLRELPPNIEHHEIEGAAHPARYEFPDRISPILAHFRNSTAHIGCDFRGPAQPLWA